MRNVYATLVLTCLCAIGCDRKSESTRAPAGGGGASPSAVVSSPAADAGTVVLYTSVDEPYARPIKEQFEKSTGIKVTLVTDAEASKSVGLAERLKAEAAHPQCDVWWDNEVFLTVNLADENVLAAYDSPSAKDIPAKYKDAKHRWAGSALRVRVIVASPKYTGPKLTKLGDLLRPALKDKIALARPTAGTTGGQVAALYADLGTPAADAFFKGLHANGAKLLGGNGVVAESVARGTLLAGLCDNDDAASVAAEVGPLTTILPGQGDGDPGTPAMPCAVSLVNNAPHPTPAKQLIDFLLTAKTDQALIDAHFAWCSARDVKGKGKFMAVDYEKVAKAMPAAIRTATSILDGR